MKGLNDYVLEARNYQHSNGDASIKIKLTGVTCGTEAILPSSLQREQCSRRIEIKKNNLMLQKHLNVKPLPTI